MCSKKLQELVNQNKLFEIKRYKQCFISTFRLRVWLSTEILVRRFKRQLLYNKLDLKKIHNPTSLVQSKMTAAPPSYCLRFITIADRNRFLFAKRFLSAPFQILRSKGNLELSILLHLLTNGVEKSGDNLTVSEKR